VVPGLVAVSAWRSLRIDRGTIVQEAFGRGTIESQREAAVGFDLVGRLSEVLVDEGARVTLGQELARLETDQAQADLRSAQTGIGAARASLQRLAAEEERARALLATAEREAARTRRCSTPGPSPGSAARRGERPAARGSRRARSRSGAALGGDPRHRRRAGGAEQRRVAMVRATLLAPFDGLVTRRLREPGDTVTVGSTVLRIVDTNRVYVNAAVDETMLPLLATDQPAAIFFPGTELARARPRERISWEADRQTHELLVEVTPDRWSGASPSASAPTCGSSRAPSRMPCAFRSACSTTTQRGLRVRGPRRQDRAGPPDVRPHGERPGRGAGGARGGRRRAGCARCGRHPAARAALGGTVNLALRDVRRHLARFMGTAAGLGLLLSVVVAMQGIYAGWSMTPRS
jgi:pyruvate/2-oxoglutarate dehydrogenase complex dihydrolipoamide acyltransferase (E2) component